MEDFQEVEVPENGINDQAKHAGEEKAEAPVDDAPEPTREELLSVLRGLLARLNLKKYAMAYTQYLFATYGLREPGELTVAPIQEQIALLQQCLASKPKLNQLRKILEARQAPA